MESIEAIVHDLKIPEKKRALDERRELISYIKFGMSELETHNKMVALYAYNLSVIKHETDEKLVKNARLANVMLIKREPDVEAYESLRKDLSQQDDKASIYYRSIQEDLREALIDLELPNIFIYSGLIDTNDLILCRNIVLPGYIQTIKKENEVETLIYPPVETESWRKLNHFYNRISFKYLEALSQDYSFSLEGKNLGKTK